MCIYIFLLMLAVRGRMKYICLIARDILKQNFQDVASDLKINLNLILCAAMDGAISARSNAEAGLNISTYQALCKMVPWTEMI